MKLQPLSTNRQVAAHSFTSGPVAFDILVPIVQNVPRRTLAQKIVRECVTGTRRTIYLGEWLPIHPGIGDSCRSCADILSPCFARISIIIIT
jgi:hypothetical protein